MSDLSSYVSNGTCYTKAGEKLDSSFIPCGNDAFGHQTCCGAGDNCLYDNACFGFHGSGYGSYLTYMAGCTDPEYTDSSCPQKDVDQPWIALTLCDNSDGAWAACSQSGNPSTLQPGAYCTCTNSASATVQFKDTVSLTSICSLPQSTGESISFFAGHTPYTHSNSDSATTASASGTSATSASSTATKTGSSGSSGSGSSATKTSTGAKTFSGSGTGGSGSSSGGSGSSAQSGSDASSTSGATASGSGSGGSSQTGSNASSAGGTNAGSSSSSATSGAAASSSGGGGSSGLSTGAKAGIGAGVGAVALILLVAILIFLLRRRRRHSPKSRRPRSEVESGSAKLEKPYKPDPKDQRISALSTAPTVKDADGQLMSEADGVAAPPWNLRSELEGSPVVSLSENPGGFITSGGPQEPGIRHSGEMGPVAELAGGGSEPLPARTDLHKADRHPQGPTHAPPPPQRQPGPRYRGIEMTSQAAPFSIHGPDEAQFTSD